MDDLPDLPVEKMLSYLPLKDLLKVSISFKSKI